MRPIVQSYKQIQQTNLSLIAGTQATQVFVTGVDNYVGPTLNNEVPTGAKVFSVDVQIDLINPSSGIGSLHMYFGKRRSGQNLASNFPDADAVGGSDVRNQIFHQFQTMFGTSDGKAVIFHKRLKVPGMMQRVREGDQLFVALKASIAITGWISFIYKFYR